MQILGFDPALVTIAICIIGVSYQIITGMAGKPWREFNPILAGSTFMIGIVTSIGLVAPVIDALPDNLGATMQLAAIAGQIGLVMGIDSAIRKGQKIGQKIKDKKLQEDNLDELEPIDDSNDLPPGKDATEKID